MDLTAHGVATEAPSANGFAPAAACDGPEEIGRRYLVQQLESRRRSLEDARHLAQWDQTIALIWFEDEEVPSPEPDRHKREEEEFGLAELDGVLPWPGKKRRK